MLQAEGVRAGYGTTPVLQDLDLAVGLVTGPLSSGATVLGRAPCSRP